MADYDFTQEQIELIKRTIAQDATDDELKLFLYTARRVNLDPLLGQVQFIKRRRKNKDGKWEEHGQTLFGRDSYRIVAHRSEALDGIEVQPIFEDGKLVSATATVWRRDCGHPFTATVFLTEYNDPERSFLWRSKPITMLSKVAEAHALRMAFPDLLGLYAPEEFGLTDADILEGGQEPKRLPGPPQGDACLLNGKHWFDHERPRERFLAWIREASLSDDEVYEALGGIKSVRDFRGSMAEAKSLIQAYIDAHAHTESEPPEEEAE